MSPAALDAWAGNQSIASTITMPIAVAARLSRTAHIMGRRLRIASPEALHGARVYATARTSVRCGWTGLADRGVGGGIEGIGTSNEEEHRVQVREGMSSVVLTVGPHHTLREAARAMAERAVGAAIVV